MTSPNDSPAHAAMHELLAARRRALARLRLLMLLAIVVPTVAFLGVAAYLHKRDFADATTKLDRSARVAHEHALKLFDTNEMLLQRMLDLLGDRGSSDLLDDAQLTHLRLARMADRLPQVQGLFVMGADARMLASSRVFPPRRDIDYTDRDWYQAHSTGDAGVFFTRQIVSRATGERAFDMSRRREVRGRFEGSVHVSLRPEYLTDFYSEMAVLDPGLRMTVVRLDGGVVARWPGVPPIDQTVPLDDPMMRLIAGGQLAGSLVAPSPFDETERLRAFRRLGPYPLYIVASMDRKVVTSAWLQRVGLLALFVFPLAIGLAVSARLSRRRVNAEIKVVQRLDEETARRQRAEIALLQAQKLEAMGRLTGGVAHDFNNLLSVVGSNVEVLRRLNLDPVATGRLDAIARSVASGAKLTRQLLAFARKQALLPRRVVLQEHISELLDLLRPLLRAAIQIEATVHPQTPPVDVDPAELELALINVAINASDAMSGSGRLTINVYPGTIDAPETSTPRDFVVVDMDDTGPGIPASVVDKVFEPFFTTKPAGQGTGLGLSQVRAFAQSAGGDANILPAPGGGARVRLWLKPSVDTVVQAADAPRNTPVVQARVLLVEDNDDVADATSRLLEAMGAQVARASSGEEALAFMGERRAWVDVVISDIQMPGDMDGIALAAELASQAWKVPVVLVTGYAQQLNLAVARNMVVLPKPFTPEALSNAIEKAMGHSLPVVSPAEP